MQHSEESLMTNKKQHMSKDDWAAINNQMALKTPEELRAWIRKAVGPEHRRVEGHERSELMLMFALMTPIGESNNQRFITEVYKIAGKEYNVIYGMEEDPVVEEILEE